MALKTIKLVDGVGPDPNPASAKKNGKKGNPDQVRWQNKTQRGRTVTFTNWPFASSPELIQVPAGGFSNTYTLYASTSDGNYPYTITPSINPPDGPPDEPSLDVG